MFQEKFLQSHNEDQGLNSLDGRHDEAGVRSKEAILAEFGGHSGDSLRQMEAPMRKIVSELGAEIVRGDFHTILCDDASGRIPAFFMRKFLQRVNDVYGYESPQTIFLAGPGVKDGPVGKAALKEKELLVREYIQKRLEETPIRPNGKLMLLTETINKGTSIDFFSKILNEMGVSFEIVAVGLGKPGGFFDRRPRVGSLEEMAKHKVKLEKRFGARITYGMLGKSWLDGDRTKSGVTKKGEDLFATKYRENVLPGHAALSREFADALAQEVAEEFLATHPKEQLAA